MSFIFPPEPEVPTQGKPKNPLGVLIGPVLENVLAIDAGNFHLESIDGRVENALRSRWVENVAAVLSLAGNQEAPSEPPKEVPDAGWIQVFLRLSGGACSEIEREVWGRLLALEIAAPRSISRRTLQCLHAMDLWELESFVEYCAFAFTFESGWRFMFEGETARREMWSYGREIDLTQHWIDVGLLSNEPTTLLLRKVSGLRVFYRLKSWEVLLTEGSIPEANSPVRYRKFTAIGQQISSALSIKTFNGYARNLIKALEGQGQAFFSPLPDSETP